MIVASQAASRTTGAGKSAEKTAFAIGFEAVQKGLGDECVFISFLGKLRRFQGISGNSRGYSRDF
jgi:hypothetical protein